VFSVGGDGARIKLQGAVRRSRASWREVSKLQSLEKEHRTSLHHDVQTPRPSSPPPKCLPSGQQCRRTWRNEAATKTTIVPQAQIRATSGAEWPAQHLRPPQPHPGAPLDRRYRQITGRDQAAKRATRGLHLRPPHGPRALSAQLHRLHRSTNARQTHPKMTRIAIAVMMTLGLHLHLPAQAAVTMTAQAWGDRPLTLSLNSRTSPRKLSATTG
jgi:hypothetical protein